MATRPTTVISGYTGTSYTNTGLANGTTYYYVVAATNAGGLGPNSPEASATPSVNIVITARNLVWKGDGSANIWDVSGAPNWLSNATVTIFNNGDAATFDNSGSNNVAVTLVGTPQPALVTFNATKNYTFSGAGSITGTNVLLKSGTGALTINTTNTYSGGTVISNGSIVIGNIGANNAAWGTGPINFNGGTVQFNGYGGSGGTDWGGCTNTFNVPVGQTGTLLLPPRWGYTAVHQRADRRRHAECHRGLCPRLISAATGRRSPARSTSASCSGDSTGDFRINNVNGYANAAFYLNNGVNFYNINNNNLTDRPRRTRRRERRLHRRGQRQRHQSHLAHRREEHDQHLRRRHCRFRHDLAHQNWHRHFHSHRRDNTYSGGTTISGGTLLVNNTNGSGTGSGAVTVAIPAALLAAPALFPARSRSTPAARSRRATRSAP